jgi:hypothetical protein
MYAKRIVHTPYASGDSSMMRNVYNDTLFQACHSERIKIDLIAKEIKNLMKTE